MLSGPLRSDRHPGHPGPGPARIIEGSDQAAGRDRPVGILDQFRHGGPVERHIEPDADPAPAAHIGRDKENVRVLGDQLRLRAGRGGAPERQPVIVMVIGEADEGLLAAHEPGRLAMAEPLGCLRQRQADPAQPLLRVIFHSTILARRAR